MSTGTLVLGLVNGLIVGLLAAGFVLVYKANRFLNLAHAQLGAVPAMFLAKLVNDHGWSFWPSVFVCLPLGVLSGIVVERFLVRPVRRRTSSSVRLLLLTVGISQLLLALTFVPFVAPDTESGATYPQPFASSISIGGVVLGGMAVLTLIVVPLILLVLTVVLGYSSIGRQIRAAANNPQEARLCGISINRVSSITWALAGGMSAVSAILNGPSSSTFNVAAIGPQLLVLTMGAAAFGGFVSLPWSVGGGVLLGLVYQVVAAETQKAGSAQLAVFVVILAVIFARGGAIGRVFGSSGSPVPERPIVRVPDVLRDDRLTVNLPRMLTAVAVLVALVIPQLPYFSRDGNQFLLALLAVYALVGISLTMLIGWAGQVSLGHFGIVGVGSYLAARWIADGWTVVALLVVIGLIGAAVTVVIGLPAVRVRGLTLVVTTVGFAVLAPSWLYLQPWLGGDTPFATPVERPAVGLGLGAVRSSEGAYYLALLVLIAVVAAATSLRRSAAGRVILAVRDNERASAAFGIMPATVKLAVLALSGFLAGTAGVLWAVAWQRVTPVQFGPEISTAVLAVPVIGGLGSIAGAIGATVFVYATAMFVAPHLTPLLGDFGTNAGFLLLLAGIGVVAGMVQFPNGLAGKVQSSWQSYLDGRAARRTSGAHGPEVETPPQDDVVLVMPPPHELHLGTTRSNDISAAPTALPLAVRDVAVRFGGVHALDGVDVEVRPGEIVGLIGQNGAGKTTLMNVISGGVKPVRGSVQVFGNEVVDLPADVRAGYGLARSFQDASLFSGLTVRETIQLPIAQKDKPGILGALAAAPWSRQFDRTTAKRADEIVDMFGLTRWADALTSQLSTGMRRICDLAAQVASAPELLLLDEPTAGVAQREAEAFGPLVRRIRDELDCAMLIIEHDMPLLMGLCDRVYAMETGRVIAEGTPTEIREDPAVIASYLGTEVAAIERSGGPSAKGGSAPRGRLTATRSTS